MSDIGTDEKPWNLINDSRQHRCTMPRRPRLGATYRCSCGTVYQFRDTRLGRQWLPQSDTAHDHARSRHGTPVRLIR